MNTDIKQQLSALVDGELEKDQARFLIKRLQGDADLSGCWQRWHVAGECLRGQPVAPLRSDFAARIAQAIDAEAAPRRQGGAGVLKWVGGFAVAASVALAAVIAVDPAAGPVAPDSVAASVAPAVAAPAAQVVPSRYREQDLRVPLRLDAQLVSSTDASPYAAAVRLDPRIESYLVRHHEASAGQAPVFVPYATLVTPLRERAPAEPAR